MMPVQVSVHDVSPAWAAEVDMAVSLAARHGAKPALLVVPNFHGSWPLSEHPAFCRRLVSLAREGHETYLHGYYHESRRTMGHELARGGLIARVGWLVAQRWSSDYEAEFCDVTRELAAFRLAEGERIFAGVGLTIDGFVPPAWSMPRWLVPLLGQRGYRFTEDHGHIYDPVGGQSRSSLVLNYATRSALRLVSTLAYCRTAIKLALVAPTRLAIHPADMRYRAVRNELDRLLGHFSGRFVRRGRDLLC
jgi:predicted deacetylase